MEVKNKVAIVTGASSGIGLETARLLAKEGAKVVLAARSIEKLEAESKNLSGSMAVQADMTNENDIRRMVQETIKAYGRVDILVNNAGQGYDAAVEKIKIDTMRYILDLDLIGPLIAMQQVIPAMRKHGGGAIINISSGLALGFLPNMGAYSSAKRALVGISLTAREELKKDNISVSVIYPYITLTDFEKNTIRDAPAREWSDPNIPKPDTAEHVADKVLEAIKTGKPEVLAQDWMKERFGK